jgi:uncharacterized lipoprotein NlpE involved in copper resistance
MKFLSTLLFISMILFWGCDEPKTNNQKKPDASFALHDSHTSQNSLDWSGTYSGVMPCASCSGIETSLTLYADGTYSLQLTYLGNDEPNTFETRGRFSWNEAGNTIILEHEDEPNQFFVGENYLAKLNKDGNRVTGDLPGNYVLHKNLSDVSD